MDQYHGLTSWVQGSGGMGGVAELGDEFGFVLTSGDINNDSIADLAIGSRSRTSGSVFDAGGVNVLYGSAARLTATGGQQSLQGSGGVAGALEEGDTFGSSLA